jgi:hypothetical protein
MELSKEHDAPIDAGGRAKVGEWIAGCEAVREGFFNAFFIEVNADRSGVMITPENVDYEEAHIRNSFAEVYPELIEV